MNHAIMVIAVPRLPVLLATFVGRPLYQGGPFRFPGRPALT